MSNTEKWYNKYTMAELSDIYDIPYPVSTDPVNVHGDIKSLVERLEIILPPLGVSQFQLPVLNNSGATILAGTPVYATGYNTKTTIARSLPETVQPVLGLAKTDIENNAEGLVVVAGVMDSVNTSGFDDGAILYVAEGGGLTDNRPAGGSGAVGIVAYSNANGIIIVEAKGNGTWGALKAGLA